MADFSSGSRHAPTVASGIGSVAAPAEDVPMNDARTLFDHYAVADLSVSSMAVAGFSLFCKDLLGFAGSLLADRLPEIRIVEIFESCLSEPGASGCGLNFDEFRVACHEVSVEIFGEVSSVSEQLQLFWTRLAQKLFDKLLGTGSFACQAHLKYYDAEFRDPSIVACLSANRLPLERIFSLFCKAAGGRTVDHKAFSFFVCRFEIDSLVPPAKTDLLFRLMNRARGASLVKEALDWEAFEEALVRLGLLAVIPPEASASVHKGSWLVQKVLWFLQSYLLTKTHLVEKLSCLRTAPEGAGSCLLREAGSEEADGVWRRDEEAMGAFVFVEDPLAAVAARKASSWAAFSAVVGQDRSNRLRRLSTVVSFCFARFSDADSGLMSRLQWFRFGEESVLLVDRDLWGRVFLCHAQPHSSHSTNKALSMDGFWCSLLHVAVIMNQMLRARFPARFSAASSLPLSTPASAQRPVGRSIGVSGGKSIGSGASALYPELEALVDYLALTFRAALDASGPSFVEKCLADLHSLSPTQKSIRWKQFPVRRSPILALWKGPVRIGTLSSHPGHVCLSPSDLRDPSRAPHSSHCSVTSVPTFTSAVAAEELRRLIVVSESFPQILSKLLSAGFDLFYSDSKLAAPDRSVVPRLWRIRSVKLGVVGCVMDSGGTFCCLDWQPEPGFCQHSRLTVTCYLADDDIRQCLLLLLGAVERLEQFRSQLSLRDWWLDPMLVTL